MVRVAVNEDAIIKMLIDLSAMVGLDGVPLHFQLFPKLWLDIYNSRLFLSDFVLLKNHPKYSGILKEAL